MRIFDFSADPNYWKPDAVILIGVAFGKHNEEKPEPRQHIGDVLISEMIQDYESGAIRNGQMQSDGTRPDSGKSLKSAFKHYSKTWNYTIDNRKAKCIFGLILSGDKVVDDKKFKKQIFKAYPRAIGGEMEGRGAYAACRDERLDEWIVVKGICDWGENKDNPNKDEDQLIAARAAVSFLTHVFSNEKAFDKVPIRKQESQLYFPTPTNTIQSLVQEITLRDKTIEILKEELARKDLPQWDQTVKLCLEKGEIQKAIESIDTDASDKEAAQKHIRKAQLFITAFNFPEAENHFQQAISIFPSFSTYSEIADFNYDLNRFPEAIDYYNHCLSYATTPEEKSSVLNKLGNSHWKNNSFSSAESFYSDSLKIRRELASKHPDTYLPDVATTLNGFGLLYSDTHSYSAAESSYAEALKIYRKFSSKHPDTYLPDVATTLNNYGILCCYTHSYSAAESSYAEALKIYRKFSSKHPDSYRPFLAMTLNNFGNLCCYTHSYSAAESSYSEALKIYRELSSDYPDAYQPCVAMTLSNLGNFYRDTHSYPAAESSYSKSLKIYRELSSKHPDAYQPALATTLNNFGNLCCYTHSYPTAESFYTESLQIRRELSSKHPDAFLPDVASTLSNLGNFYRDTHSYPSAESSYSEALKIRRELASKYPDTYRPKLANTLFNLTLFYQDDVPNKELSLKYANEAIGILNECTPTPFISEHLEKAQQVIKNWDQNQHP